MEKRIYLSPPWVGAPERKAVDEAFRSGYVAPCGPMVDEFDRRLGILSGRHAAAVASGTAAIDLLMEELDRGRVEKIYEALTVGGPAEDEGLIDLPIAKRPNPSLLRYVNQSGKPARTRWRVLERGSVCRLELRPLTGRTHQLRVHCAYMGFPILGDPQYGMQNAACKMQNEGSELVGGGALDAPLSADISCPAGQQLIAKRIALDHPLTGERIIMESKLELTAPEYIEGNGKSKK